QARPVQVAWKEFPGQQLEVATSAAFHEFGHDVGCDQRDNGAGALQQRDLAQGHFTAADNQDVLTVEIEENRKIDHGTHPRTAARAVQQAMMQLVFGDAAERGRDPAARMQTAFARIRSFPPPAAGALILAGLHRSGARCAADARKAAVVQAVVRQALLANIVPDFGLGPIEQGTDLVQAIFAVPFHRCGECAAGRLTPPDACYPSATTGHGAAKRLDFADGTTAAALLETVAKAVDAV